MRTAYVPGVEFVEGLEFRPVLGESMLASFVTFVPDTEAPVHAPFEEQIVIVLEGELEFDLEGDVRTMRPGTARAGRRRLCVAPGSWSSGRR